MDSENLAKIYTIETKIVSISSAARVMEKKGGRKMEVICFKSLKTNVEKTELCTLRSRRERLKFQPEVPKGWV